MVRVRGVTIVVEEAVASYSTTLRHALKENSTSPIELPDQLSPLIVSKVLEYCAYHSTAERDGEPEDVVRAWDEAFVQMADDILAQLALAANHLDVAPLLDLVTAVIADAVAAASDDELHDRFGVAAELAPEELAEALRQHGWLAERGAGMPAAGASPLQTASIFSPELLAALTLAVPSHRQSLAHAVRLDAGMPALLGVVAAAATASPDSWLLALIAHDPNIGLRILLGVRPEATRFTGAGAFHVQPPSGSSAPIKSPWRAALALVPRSFNLLRVFEFARRPSLDVEMSRTILVKADFWRYHCRTYDSQRVLGTGLRLGSGLPEEKPSGYRESFLQAVHRCELKDETAREHQLWYVREWLAEARDHNDGIREAPSALQLLVARRGSDGDVDKVLHPRSNARRLSPPERRPQPPPHRPSTMAGVARAARVQRGRRRRGWAAPPRAAADQRQPDGPGAGAAAVDTRGGGAAVRCRGLRGRGDGAELLHDHVRRRAWPQPRVLLAVRRARGRPSGRRNAAA